MIRIDEIWLSTQPLDMRAGMDTVMAQVVRAFGYIKPHCAYLFCNKRGHRMKVLVHVNGNLKLTPFTLKQQSKIDPFDDLLRLNLWLNSYSLFIF